MEEEPNILAKQLITDVEHLFIFDKKMGVNALVYIPSERIKITRINLRLPYANYV